VVYDDLDICDLVALVLSHEGYSVRSANSGSQALAQIKADKPRLVITDLMMPEMSGDELCRKIKDDPALRDIIVFILSVRSDVQTKLDCFESGVNEYLVKAMIPEALAAR